MEGKMKLKYYMRGLAVGIIFSVFIFTLTGASQKQKMSEDEIKKAALALGMVEAEQSINLTSLTPTPTPQPTVTQAPTVTVEPTAVPEPTTIIPTPIVDSQKEKITLEIVKGMYSIEVAQKAYEVGLVDDAKAFDKYLRENGYASIIRINTFVFEKGVTYKQIAETITKKPE